MKGRYTRLLSVCHSDGQKVYAIITQQGISQVNIEVRYIEAVKQDAPPFANNGVIRFNIERKQIKEVIASLTKYIETLFLKELGQENVTSEDIYSSLGIRAKQRGNKKSSNRDPKSTS